MASRQGYSRSLLRIYYRCVLGIRIPFSVNACESEHPKLNKSGNIYKSGKILSSVKVVLYQDKNTLEKYVSVE